MTTESKNLTKLFLNYFEKNDLTHAQALLEEVLDKDPLNLEAHNLRERYHLKGNFSEWMGVNAEISPDDDIFRFFVNHPTSKNPVRDYLADGWRTMIELQDVLNIRQLSLHRCDSFLEFACGHGRFTRHLVRIFKNRQLRVSDVAPGSIDFLKKSMEVEGFYSSINPDDLNLPQKYKIIFVLSLFSHLPVHVWEPWLRLLYGSLQPGGVLVFSTHGTHCAHLDGVQLEDTGVKFFPSSESSVLDGQTYGATYASLAFVKQAVANALGTNANMQAIEGHFWSRQDAIIVSKG